MFRVLTTYVAKRLNIESLLLWFVFENRSHAELFNVSTCRCLNRSSHSCPSTCSQNYRREQNQANKTNYTDGRHFNSKGKEENIERATYESHWHWRTFAWTEVPSVSFRLCWQNSSFMSKFCASFTAASFDLCPMLHTTHSFTLNLIIASFTDA